MTAARAIMPGRTDTEHDAAIVDAVSDVITAAGHVVADRIELTRLVIRREAHDFVVVVAYGVAAATAVLLATATATAALVWLLALWLPLGAALGAVTAIGLAIGAGLVKLARRRLPLLPIDTHAIEGKRAAEEPPALTP